MRAAVLAVLLIAGSALAHDDDPVLRSLVSPVNGASCCDSRDCSLTDTWAQSRQGAYTVHIDGVGWREVPPEVVIKDRGPHPSGQAVLCLYPTGEMRCSLPGATGV